MARLDHISIHGFRSIRTVDKLEIRPINVIIGANGSGKSNLIEVFGFLHALREGRFSDYVGIAGGAARMLHFGPKITARLKLGISFDEGRNAYEIELVPTAEDRFFISSEVVKFWDGESPRAFEDRLTSMPNGEAGISSPDLTKVGKYVREKLASWRTYHFHDTSRTSALKSTADLHDNGFLRSDGSNLPAFLYFLRQRFPDSYQVLVRAVRLVAPFFADFHLEPSRLNPLKIRLEWKHRGTDGYFDSSSLSDGTIRFIALATLFLQPPELRPSVILVDEPELGLHPYAVTVLASMVKSASASNQVILSTQSPQLLDYFKPEDVLVADRIEEATSFRRLEAPALAGWLADYSLGQLWEKNEFGGRPGSEPEPEAQFDRGEYPNRFPEL